MEDYEDVAEEVAAPPASEALEAAVRPALVAATRLFLVAGVVLVVVDERGELAWGAAAGDLAELLERAIGPLWAGPCREVIAGGSLVRTSTLRDDPRWPELAAALGFAGVNSLLCVPVEGRPARPPRSRWCAAPTGPGRSTRWSRSCATAAFDRLRRAARAARRRVGEVAAEVVAGQHLPEPDDSGP